MADIKFSDWQVIDKRLPNKCSFRVENVHVGVLNAVRRAILSNIPNVAVRFDAYKEDKNDCVFLANTSALHNEFIGHRLSLIPIHLPPEVIDRYDSDDFKFAINVQNTSTEVVLVTSKHISVTTRDGRALEESERDKIFPADPITGDYVLITKLRPNLYDTQYGEKLHVEFKATKGYAKDNACWSPVSLCSYKFIINEAEAKEALVLKLADIEDKDEKERAEKIFGTLENQRYYYKNEHGDPFKYTFSIESECALTPKYLFDKAIDVLAEMLSNLVHVQDKYSTHVINEDQNLYALTIEHEDHTIGNLMQVLIFENFIRPKKGVTFAGYNVPHPLESRILLKVRFDKKTDVDAFMREVVNIGIDTLKSMQAKWRAFSEAEVTGEAAAVAALAAPKRRVVTRNKK